MTSDEINTKEIDISDFLQLEGIGPAANKEIKKGGYVSILQLAAAMQEDVENSCDISADKAKKYIKAAQEWLDQSGVMNSRVTSGLDDLERREQMQKITTGSSNLDKLLKGGIETGAITEFFADFGSGKTQICNMVAINAQLPPEKGGISAKGVIYIDTEGTFRPERIKNICIELGLDYREILSNITRIRTGTLPEFIYRIKTLSNEIERRNAKVIIIDSIISRSRQEKIGRGTLADRQQVLGQLLHRIMRCAEIYNAAVILANQVQANPDTYGDPTKPAGGNVLGHACCASDSLVVTQNGIKQIKDVKVGIDKIFNGYKFVNILDKSEVQEKECLELKSNNFITCSLEHKFPIFDNDGNFIKDEIAENLRVGDNLLGLNPDIKNDSISMDLIEKIQSQKLDITKIYPIKEINKIGKKQVIDISVEGEYFYCNGVITHNSTYRLSIRKSGKKRVVTMVDSPMGAFDSVDIEITERGIEDFVENRKSAKAKKQGKENKETETSESQEQPQEDSESEHDLVIA